MPDRLSPPGRASSAGARPGVPGWSSAVWLCLLCGLAMAYGWGWRGSYGHEAGAMLPGALLGMSLCLASRREDWHRRTPLAGLCGAVGWSWGGALSNMEQTFYVVSDSLPDVLWAFAGVFLVGLLWSGIGSSILSLAFTQPRSLLNNYISVLTANALALFGVFVLFQFRPGLASRIEVVGREHLHDTKFLAASLVFAVSSAYWLARPAARHAAGLFVQCAAAWWVGYLALTKFGGIELAPPNRSESWGGFVGVLAVLAAFHYRARDRAGLWMTLGGALSGGLAFVLALALTHPLVVRWGPFADTTITNTWKLTEETFGGLMGLGVAATVLGLLRGRLAPPVEDADPRSSNEYAAFVLLVVMNWLNLRKNVRDWGQRYDLLPGGELAGLLAWQWFLVLGVLFTLLAVYAFWLLHRGRLAGLLPPTPWGQGALLFLLVLWIAQTGVALHRFADWKQGGNILVEVSYWMLAALTTLVLLTRVPEFAGQVGRAPESRGATDPYWRPGPIYWTVCALVPLLIAGASFAAMAMQDGPHPKYRLRFGPEAYWRLEAQRNAAAGK